MLLLTSCYYDFMSNNVKTKFHNWYVICKILHFEYFYEKHYVISSYGFENYIDSPSALTLRENYTVGPYGLVLLTRFVPGKNV